MNMNENNNLSIRIRTAKRGTGSISLSALWQPFFAMSMIMFLNAEIQRNTQKKLPIPSSLI